MAFEIIILKSAQLDLEQALDYYQNINAKTLQKFNKNLQSAYKTLQNNPFFKISHSDYRVLPIQKFPYLLVFTVDQNAKIIKIYSIFHTAQNPNKLPE